MDFSSISRRSRTLGNILRFPLDLIPKDMVLPIMQGVMRGRRWIVGSSLHSCWLGSYEVEKQGLIASCLRPGDVFYDLGANVGFYTLLAARTVGDTGHVYAFEPFPGNIQYLRRHMSLNEVHNATVYEVAVTDKGGQTRFQTGARASTGKVSEGGDLVVRAVSLDNLIAQDQLRLPQVIKIDVEGGEYAVLRGAARLLTAHAPTIFLATHGDHVHRQCVQLLMSWGYRLESFPSVDGGGEIVALGRDAAGGATEQINAPSNK